MRFEVGQQQETFLNCLLILIVAGIFFASNFILPVTFIFALSIIFFIISIILLRRNSKFTFIPFCILFFILGAIRFQVVNTLPANDISNFVGEQVYICGTIREQPHIHLNADMSYSIRYVVDVENIRIKNEMPATGGLNLNVRYKSENEIPTARIGDKISSYGILRQPINFNNPGQLDIVTMLKCENITANLSASKTGVHVEKINGSIWIKFLRLMADIREHYKNSMRSVMSNQEAVAIFAMLFGGYEGLKPELTESFVTTGIVHILSVSGSHMTLLAVVTAWICNIFGWSKSLKFATGVIVIGSYIVLSGCVPPVLRSGYMGILLFFATSFGYISYSRRLLTLIAIFMLLYSPLLLFHISFQLSFLSSAGILYFAPKITKILKEYKMPIFLAISIACTTSVTITSQPIIAWYFNQMSVSALLSNLIVIPILEFIIIISLIGGIIGLIIAPLAKIIFIIDSLIFGAAYELNKLIANIPFSKIYFPTIDFAWSIIYYLILIFFAQNKNNKKIIISYFKENIKYIQTAAIIIILVIAFKLGMNLSKPAEVEVHFIDVHQGDCALLITPNGHAMMFDTGGVREHTFDIGSRVDIPYLYHYGITKLDYIFLSHAHEDHTAGAGSIIKKIQVDKIITAGESKSVYATSMAISESAPELNVLRKAIEGEIFDIDGVKVEVIYAPDVNDNLTGNEVSNVYKVTFKNVTFLFTGDLIKENEQIILNERKNIKSTLLKVGHHGSKTSSSKEFIEAVQPQFAVFCVGANNTFGHPRAEVIELIKSVGAEIYRTDKNGAIIFRTDGNKISVKTTIN